MCVTLTKRYDVVLDSESAGLTFLMFIFGSYFVSRGSFPLSNISSVALC